MSDNVVSFDEHVIRQLSELALEMVFDIEEFEAAGEDAAELRQLLDQLAGHMGGRFGVERVIAAIENVKAERGKALYVKHLLRG